MARRHAPRSCARRSALALSLTLLGLLTCPGTTAADLRFVGRAPRESLWRETYHRLPRLLRRDVPVVVEEVPDDEMERRVARDARRPSAGTGPAPSIQGYYEPRRRGAPARIVLRESLSPPVAGLAFAHEYGHVVWDEILSARQRAEYARIWRRQATRGWLVTRYAGESAPEGFAEAFAYYVRRGRELERRDPDSATFLDDLADGPAQ